MIDDPNFHAILGDRKERYLPRFARLLEKAKGDPVIAAKTRGWNWMGFVGTSFWLLYHRMYLQGFGLLAIGLTLPLLFGSSAGTGGIVMAILTGLYGDGQLFQHVHSKALARANLATDAERLHLFDRTYANSSPLLAWGTASMVIALGLFLEFGGSRSCGSTETVALLRSISGKHFADNEPLFRSLQIGQSDLSITFEHVRETDSNSRATRCAADLVLKLADTTQSGQSDKCSSQKSARGFGA